MNILHITQLKKHPEGIGTVLSALIPEQKKLGHNVYLASTNSNAKCSDIHTIDFSSIKNVKETLQTINIDIVVFHGVYNKKYIALYKYLINKEIPYMITLHGALSKENYKKNRFRKWIANLLYFGTFLKSAKSIIYLNESEYRNSIVPRYNKAFSFIPNGCHISDSFSVKPESKQIKFLYMGRLDINHKGLDVLFDALRLSVKDYIKFHIDFYGKMYDDQRAYVEDNIKLLHSIASYKGIVEGSEKDDIYKHADLFILTSRYEGMPMGVLEALSYGIPCILTPGTNMADVVANAGAGWKCELNAKSIAETIKKAIEDYCSNKILLRTAAMELAKSYSWSEIAKKSIEIYQNKIGYEKDIASNKEYLST